MPGNSFGELFRITTAGVSHGPGYLAIIDGCPPGLPLSVDDLLPSEFRLPNRRWAAGMGLGRACGRREIEIVRVVSVG